MNPFTFIDYNFFIILLCASLTHSAELWLYCGSLDNYTSTDLADPLPLLNNTCFDESLKSIFYAFGYNTTPQDEITEVVIDAYLDLEEYNVFEVNWEKEADAGDTALEYIFMYPADAIPNAIKVGKLLGEALNTMSEASLDLDITELLGHSLGAHLVGTAGTQLQTHNKNVSRVTGMDPAGPGFELGILRGLTPSCGKFVVAYHTNPGRFGIVRPVGQVDFWFNCQDVYQPKCQNLTLSKRDGCSHLAINYYVAEATRNPFAFAAAPSKSCRQWVAQGNTTVPLVYAGEYTDPDARGNVYLRTNALSPYGMGEAGAVAST